MSTINVRDSRVDWDTYFFNIARAVSKRASCPRASVGAILVADTPKRGKIILSSGYNGAPKDKPDCIDAGCLMESNHCIRVVHAEQNAIRQYASTHPYHQRSDEHPKYMYVWFDRRTSRNYPMEGSAHRMSDFPCSACLPLIEQEQVQVVYLKSTVLWGSDIVDVYHQGP